MMTGQEMFDEVVTQLVKQGGPSYKIDKEENNKRVCLYRGPNNRRCAIGWLIKDEDYKPEFETSSVLHLVENNKVKLSIVDFCFLFDLQAIHDNEELADKDNWKYKELKERFKNFTRDYGLDDSVVDRMITEGM